MTTRRALVLIVVTAALVLVAFATGAAAQDGGSDDDQVVLTGSLDVPEGASVDTAVIFNGPATIEGTVTGSLVVFNGDVEVSGTVQDQVVVFNGHVTIRSGSRVGGDVASREPPTVEDGASIGGTVRGLGRYAFKRPGWFLGRLVWWLGYSVSTLILGLLLLALAPALDGALHDVATRRIGAGFGAGALVFFLVPIAAILFLVLIVSIPLGLFLLLALALLDTVGYVAGLHGIGRRLIRPPRSRFGAFLAGWAILRGIALIPVVGGLSWVVTSILGLGLLTVAARSRPVVAAATPVPPPPEPA